MAELHTRVTIFFLGLLMVGFKPTRPFLCFQAATAMAQKGNIPPHLDIPNQKVEGSRRYFVNALQVDPANQAAKANLNYLAHQLNSYKRVMIILDHSGSMDSKIELEGYKGTNWEYVKIVLTELLRFCSKDLEMGLIAVGDDCRTRPEDFVLPRNITRFTCLPSFNKHLKLKAEYRPTISAN